MNSGSHCIFCCMEKLCCDTFIHILFSAVRSDVRWNTFDHKRRAISLQGHSRLSLLFLGLLSFIVLFSLANNPDIAIMPSFLLGFGLMIGIPVGLSTGVINLASWSFTLYYLAGAIVVWAVVCYLSRLLTREQIGLSSKGG